MNKKVSPAAGTPSLSISKDEKVLYINLFVNDAKEGTKRKIKSEVNNLNLPPPIKAVASKVAPKVASKLATPQRVAQLMSQKLPELLPQKLKEKGMTAAARNVYVEDNFAVFEIQIQHVDMKVLIKSQTVDVVDEDGDVEPATLDQSLGEKILQWIHRIFALIGGSKQQDLEGRVLPRAIQKQMIATMGDMLEEKMEIKGMDMDPVVLPEEKQARFFFDTLQDLRKNR